MSTLNTKKRIYTSFIIPVFIILISLINYSRLTGTENIRAIHVVTLLVMGMGIGILLRNLIAYLRGHK
ncbi:MAG: hypothetical protein J0M18_01230 [Ignavibacteria bacterium]|nr:hypothetical protein [Ignavibacteria bacterium]